MQLSDILKVGEEAVSAATSIMSSKNTEYAAASDGLANFKTIAEQMGITAEQALMVYAQKHWNSIFSYIQKAATGTEAVLSEPIDGRIHDVINYMILLKSLLVEKGVVSSNVSNAIDAVSKVAADASSASNVSGAVGAVVQDVETLTRTSAAESAVVQDVKEGVENVVQSLAQPAPLNQPVSSAPPATS